MRLAALLGLTIALIACGHPTDGVLVKRLADKKQAFESIVRMAKEDKRLVRVAPDFTWLADNISWPRKDIGLTPDRWDRYRELFREAGVPEGYLRLGEDQIQLLASTKGLVTGGSAKGYVYSQTKLEPLFRTLDGPPLTGSNDPGYRHVEGPWYLFYEWDD